MSAYVDEKHLNQLSETITLEKTNKILEFYQQDIDKKLYMMGALANVGDTKKLQAEARSIKGSSANLGIAKMINAARALELDPPKESTELKKAVESLKNEFTLVKKGLYVWSHDKKAAGKDA